MILYAAISTYHLLNCLTHRALYYPDEKAVLLIDQNDLHRTGNKDYAGMILAGLFDEVYRFPRSEIDRNNVIEAVSVVLRKIWKYSLYSFSRIYVAGIHSDFAVYLAHNRIHFSAFEDGAGQLSRTNEFLIGLSSKFNSIYEMTKKYGLHDYTCSEIDQIFYDDLAQLPNFTDPRAIPFNIIERFAEVPKAIQKSIMLWFGYSRIDLAQVLKRDTIFQTQSFSLNGYMSYKKECEMIKKIVKRYANENELIIKPHPDNVIPFRLFFSNVYLFPGSFPMELIPFICDRKMIRLICIDSTGARIVSDRFDQVITLYWEYLDSYKLEDEYIAALKMLYDDPCVKAVSMVGIDYHHIGALINVQFPRLRSSFVEWEFLANGKIVPSSEKQKAMQKYLIIDSEKVLEKNLSVDIDLINNCIERGGSIIAVNNLRGVTLEDKLGPLRNCNRDLLLIDTDVNNNRKKKLILKYTSSRNR